MDYYKNKESVEEYIKMAEGHSGIKLIDELKKFLPKRSQVLELGTGPGTDWEILSKDYQVTASDFSKEFLERLIENHPNGEFLELDASTIETGHQFDCIYSNKVLHHLSDEQLDNSIKRQWEIVNPGGVICHSFWKGEGSETFKGMYVNYHIEEKLKRRLEGKFEVVLSKSYPEFEAEDSFLIIARKEG